MEQARFIPIGRGRGGRGRGFRRLPELSRTDEASSNNDQVEECSKEATDSKGPEQGSSTSASVKAVDEANQTVAERLRLEKCGSKGDRCHCLTNFVKLTKTQDVSVYQYQVSFIPSLENTRTKKLMVLQLEQAIGHINTFDGHILYLPVKLSNEFIVLNCKNPNNNSDVVTTIKFVKEKNSPDELTQFYTTLFQRILVNNGYLEIRRGFYKVSDVKEFTRERLQVWPGVTLTCELKDDGLMLMFDTPNRVMRLDSIYDFYKQMREKDGDLQKLRETFSAFVVGKIVLCKYSNQCYKIDDVGWNLTPNSYFSYRNKQVSFFEYYRTQYGVTIEDLDQPLVVSRIKPRNVNHPNPPTEAARVIALVPELCYLTGVTSEQRSNNKLMTEIRTITQLNPRLRMSALTELIKDITDSPHAQELMASWGLKVDEEALDAVGRHLSSPALLFDSLGESKRVQSNFSKEACRSCFHPITVSKFFVLCVHHDLDYAKSFLTEYAEACAILGIKLRTNGEIIKVNNNREKITPSMYVKALEDSCKNCDNVQFVVVMLPFYRDDIYRAVKRFCLTISPIPSQCVMSKTMRHRSLKKVVINICLQINCKLGGSLWGLSMPKMKKIMVIGMDAAHDPTRKNPSVIALVATLNAKCTMYFSRCGYQPIHQEVCTSLRIIFKDALDAYVKCNAGELPDSILFYRDGGSAGTFDVLKKYEIDTCLEVLEEDCVKANKTVNFSYICVAKRIPQRILLRSEGRNIVNPTPGTVLDHCITVPGRYDFYIVSQQATQGTVNPTHYSVLYETKRTPPDVMQKISYALTFMYYNWQGTIKVPSVIQYSHKLGQLVSRIQAMPNRSMSNNLYFL